MSVNVREELIEALGLKLLQLGKMQRHLLYSQSHVAIFLPLTNMEMVNDKDLEALAALKGRFAELQDHLAAAMKLLARLENQDTAVFTFIVNYMEKIGVVSAARAWHDMRELRNDAAHEYSIDPVVQANFYNKLFAEIPELLRTLTALEQFYQRAYAGEKS